MSQDERAVELMRNEFIEAAAEGADQGDDALGYSDYATPAASVIYGFSLNELLKAVADKALELGREYRGDIVSAARQAIDALVALDIPGIPAMIEAAIDEATKELAYTAVDSILDAVLGKVLPPA